MQRVKLGNLGMQVKGEWNKDAVYERLDIVRYNNASYLAMHELTILGDAPDKSAAWMCLAKDGTDGKDGIDGINGKDGKNGINGINGKDGKDGKDGVNGRNGIDGVSGVVEEWSKIKALALISPLGALVRSRNIGSAVLNSEGQYTIYSSYIKLDSVIQVTSWYDQGGWIPYELRSKRASGSCCVCLYTTADARSGGFQIIVI